jgi:hypothetical protein
MIIYLEKSAAATSLALAFIFILGPSLLEEREESLKCRRHTACLILSLSLSPQYFMPKFDREEEGEVLQPLCSAHILEIKCEFISIETSHAFINSPN